jgi:hypothetical protein
MDYEEKLAANSRLSLLLYTAPTPSSKLFQRRRALLPVLDETDKALLLLRTSCLLVACLLLWSTG